MKCEECRDLVLTDFLDGELSEDRRVELLSHIGSCEACRKHLENSKRTLVKPFENLQRAKVFPRLWERIAGELEIDPAPGSSGPESVHSGKPGQMRFFLLSWVVLILVVVTTIVVFSRFSCIPPSSRLAGPLVSRAPPTSVVENLIATCRRDTLLEKSLKESLNFGTNFESIFLPAELFPIVRLSK